MKHTRKPVDDLISQVKTSGLQLPTVKLTVTKDGINFFELGDTKTLKPMNFSVEIISYGVQDLVYTRVFSMIVVLENYLHSSTPFECHSFVCESRDQARRMTYALAAAFQDYGRRVKSEGLPERPIKKFAVDLRTPEEQANDISYSDNETDV